MIREEYVPSDHPEHRIFVDTATHAMYAQLERDGGSIPLTMLFEAGVAAVAGDMGPCDCLLRWPQQDNLFLAAGLPDWGTTILTELLRKYRDTLALEAGGNALMIHMYSGAPMLDLPVATGIRSYATQHWLPVLVTWSGK